MNKLGYHDDNDDGNDDDNDYEKGPTSTYIYPKRHDTKMCNKSTKQNKNTKKEPQSSSASKCKDVKSSRCTKQIWKDGE